LQSYAAELSARCGRGRAISVIRIYIVGAKQPECYVPGQVDIETTAGHKSDLVNVVKGIRHEAMVTYQHLKERRNMGMSECNLGTEREVRKRCVIDSIEKGALSTAPVSTRIQSEANPTVEVIGQVSAHTAWVRLKSTTDRNYAPWKDTVHVSTGMPERISAEKLPFRSWLILSAGTR
jgi:hypothetical protein